MSEALTAILGILLAVALGAIYFSTPKGDRGNGARILVWAIVVVLVLLAMIEA